MAFAMRATKVHALEIIWKHWAGYYWVGQQKKVHCTRQHESKLRYVCVHLNANSVRAASEHKKTTRASQVCHTSSKFSRMSW